MIKKGKNIELITDLVIDRSKWVFGKPSKGSLLNNEGLMCCLGFYCKAVGYRKNDILNHVMPDDVVNFSKLEDSSRACKLKPLLNLKLRANNKICSNLASVNDSNSIVYKNIAKRENRIKQLFSKIGVKVKFVGEVPENED